MKRKKGPTLRLKYRNGDTVEFTPDTREYRGSEFTAKFLDEGDYSNVLKCPEPSYEKSRAELERIKQQIKDMLDGKERP